MKFFSLQLISFVLLSGEYSQTPSRMANMLTNAIQSYIRATPPSTIELIDVVVYQHDVIPYYLEALKVASQENASTETTLVAE